MELEGKAGPTQRPGRPTRQFVHFSEAVGSSLAEQLLGSQEHRQEEGPDAWEKAGWRGSGQAKGTPNQAFGKDQLPEGGSSGLGQ